MLSKWTPERKATFLLNYVKSSPERRQRMLNAAAVTAAEVDEWANEFAVESVRLMEIGK